MTKWTEVARTHWISAAVAALAVVMMVLLAVGEQEEPDGTQSPAPSADVSGERMLQLEAAFREPPPERLTEAGKNMALIADYEARIERDPAGEDRPALMNAAATLYRQKFQDYAQAALWYERILLDHPDWERVNSVYPLLASCYEAMNDDKSLKWLCETMMERFPAGSNEHEFARQKLGME